MLHLGVGFAAYEVQAKRLTIIVQQMFHAAIWARKFAASLSALESRQFSVQDQIFVYKENSVQDRCEAGFIGMPGIRAPVTSRFDYPLYAIHNARVRRQPRRKRVTAEALITPPCIYPTAI